MRSDPPGDVAPFDAVLPVLPGVVKLHVPAVLIEIPPTVEVDLRAWKAVMMLVVAGAALARPPEAVLGPLRLLCPARSRWGIFS